MIHWHKRPLALVALVVLAASIAAIGDAIHWAAFTGLFS